VGWGGGDPPDGRMDVTRSVHVEIETMPRLRQKGRMRGISRQHDNGETDQEIGWESAPAQGRLERDGERFTYAVQVNVT